MSIKTTNSNWTILNDNQVFSFNNTFNNMSNVNLRSQKEVCGRLILKCLYLDRNNAVTQETLHSSQYNYRARHFPIA